jgi:hypothetical protein
LMMLLL